MDVRQVARPFLRQLAETCQETTITDPHALRQELIQARKQGYAVSQEELEEGMNVVAAPIYDHTGQVTASVSVAGPAYRVTPELLPKLAARLMDATAKISERLGYGGG